LTEERERHIEERHPDLLPAHRDKLAVVLADPDTIRGSVRAPAARLFSRWYTDVRRGRHVVVVVLSEEVARHPKSGWGEVEWHRS
jgi:hypothetical protein